MKATARPEKSLLTAASRGAPHLHCPWPPATVAFRSHPHQCVAVRPHVLARVVGGTFFRFGIFSWPICGQLDFVFFDLGSVRGRLWGTQERAEPRSLQCSPRPPHSGRQRRQTGSARVPGQTGRPSVHCRASSARELHLRQCRARQPRLPALQEAVDCPSDRERPTGAFVGAAVIPICAQPRV
jgi:hypothetical protein